MIAPLARRLRERVPRRATTAPIARRMLVTATIVTGLATAVVAPAAARTRDLGAAGWQVQSSALDRDSGAEISQPDFTTSSWLRVHNDGGGAPGTELDALVRNGRCPDVYFATNLRTCFGYMDVIGADTVARFAVPWWFRTTFRVPSGGDSRFDSLIVNGVVGQADVFLDGRELATHRTVQGDDTRFVFDVSSRLRPGRNAVALRVYPNDPSTMFTLDNVDWTQIPPDNNTGIQFPVQLHSSGAISLSEAHIVQRDARGLGRAALTIKGEVTNHAATPRRAVVSASIIPPGHARRIRVTTTLTLPGHSSRVAVLSPAAHPALVIHHPAVWWPYQMGAQPLYTLRVAADADAETQTFGIRTITTRLVGRGPLTPDGSRQFLVNGVPFVFRGGGWSEDLLLRYSAANTAAQIGLIRNLGLDAIRTEGKQMPADFYEQMDRAGILIDAGYQCCDAWQLQDSHLTSPHDFHLLYLSALTIGRNLRDHPSVLDFSWSDDPPTAEQERVSLRGFARADFADPLVSSAEYASSPRLGPSGEKEGPYDWVPPSYWYDRTHDDPGDSTRTNVGGAWGFDSEASAGDTIPTLDSIRRFLSTAEQTQLWQDPDANQYHLNDENMLPGPKNGGYAFGTLHDFDRALAARYGPWASLAQYVQEAQLQDYETQRAEFEAYIAHSHAARSPSTGIDYWQLNKGWPTLLWDLYNNDFDQAGSYFGAQEANRRLHVFYAYDTGAVGVDNLGGRTARGLVVSAEVHRLDGATTWRARSRPLSLRTQGVADGVLHPRVPARTTPPAPAATYFVALTLTRHGRVLDRNTYWLSTQPDAVDWRKTIGQPQATMTRYADLTALRTLPAARISVTAHERALPGPLAARRVAEVTITDSSDTVAFFVRTDLRRGAAAATPASGDDELRPVFWSADDTTLWPGQSETVRVAYDSSQLDGAPPVITVSGDNVAARDVPVSSAPAAAGASSRR